jgi:hypothetical protein
MPTSLNYDVNYLKRLVDKMVEHFEPKTLEEATWLADLRDYFMWLTLDGLEDASLALKLQRAFETLALKVEMEWRETPVSWGKHNRSNWVRGFIFALEQLLSLKRQITRLPNEKISRRGFMESWKRTVKSLDLEG